MKKLQLHNEYTRLSNLAHEDLPLFSKLVNGQLTYEAKNRFSPSLRSEFDLLIMPISLDQKLTCQGFAIERHQLFRSARTKQWYLVFYPVPTLSRYNVYEFVKSRKQEGYVYLHRRKDVSAPSLFVGCGSSRMIVT